MKLTTVLITIAVAGFGPLATGAGLARDRELDGHVLVLNGQPEVRDEDAVRSLAARLPASRVLSDGGRVVWDLGGGIIDGRKCKRHKSKQDERNAGLDVLVPNLTLRNGFVRELWGGIIFRAGGGRVENVTWLNVGEDAVSTKIDRAPGLRVVRCTFYNERGDKSVQLNDARNARVTECTFYGGITAIRWQDHRTKARKVDCYSRANEFIDVETAHNVGGKMTTLHVDEASETYRQTPKRIVTSYGSKIAKGSW
jgi:Pectate lyase